MLETLTTAVDLLNSLSPLAVIGLLAYIVFLMVAKKGPIATISNNHLSGLPEMAASLERMERTLGEIRDGMNYVRGRLNGNT